MEKNSWIVVITTLITVGGTVAIALINRTPAKPEPPVAPPVVDSGGKTGGGTETPPPPVKVADSQVETVRAPVTPAREPTPPPAAETGPTVAGAWHDYLHRDYVIVVNGNVAQLTGPEFPTGMPAMASGTGTGIQWNFNMANGNTGTCGGVVTGTQLNVMCNSMAGSFPFPLHRPGT